MLAPELLIKRTFEYSLDSFDFVSAASACLGVTGDLGQLHERPIRPPSATAPALRRAQVQAQVGERVSKMERKLARNRAQQYEKTESFKYFMEVYRRFIFEFVMPQMGDVPLLYQRKPILRVVLPGSVPPTQMHCDADYYHDSNEVNWWVPLSHVSGSNTLWSESAPGQGDYEPFVAHAGQAIRFYGNRCRHYTIANACDGRTRVSFDFRVIPFHLFQPPTETAATLSRHALDPASSKRGYYALACPPGWEDELQGGSLGALRRTWRETVQHATRQPTVRDAT